MTRSPWLSLWLGAALSSLFFYPLVAALADSPFSLQWQPLHGLELGVGFGLLTLLLGALLHAAEGVSNPVSRLVALVALLLMPMASAIMYMLRQLGAVHALNAIATSSLENPIQGLALALALTLACGGAAFLALRRAAVAVVVVRVGLLILSPLTFLSIFQATQRSLETVPIIIDPSGDAVRGQRDLPDIFVLLFDELDYSYLYEGDHRVRSGLPNFASLAATSDNYHHATSPGRMTLTSIPGLVTGVRGLAIDPGSGVYGMRRGTQFRRTGFPKESLFSRAQRIGYRTAIQGWGMPYCQMLGSALDACRSFSKYNRSTANLSFSPLDPVLTTFALWPFQRPFGFFKSFAGTRHQRALVEQTYARAVAALDREGALLQLTHFSIPHDPFIYDTDRYSPTANPYLRDQDGYRRQLRYVDRLLGEFLAELEARGRLESAFLIVLSDHAYRVGVKRERHQEIPLLVKAPRQTERRDVFAATRSEELLGEILASTAATQ